jgi:uncharacterized protein YjbI with pentapeptide repeats
MQLTLGFIFISDTPKQTYMSAPMINPGTAAPHYSPLAYSEAILRRYAAGERDFAKIKLADIDLSSADLRGANFSEADLTDATLEHADLSNSNFQGATLLRTVLRGANLENVDFTKATGLLPAQLAGTNLAGVRLPERFGDFDALRVVEEESKNARTLFFGTLLACVYGWLTIASTTDALLLTNSSSSPLPIIGASIPIVSFFVVGPLMLFLLYIYLHLHLQRLWERLADLPAVFPDGRSLGKRAYPWLLTGLVYSFNPYLKGRRPPLSRLQAGVSLLVAWWLMPLTIILFWGRYLRRHDWIGTTLHIVVLVGAIAAGILLYQLAATTLRGQRKNLASVMATLTSAATYKRLLWILALAVVVYVFSFGIIEGVPPDFESVDGDQSLIQANLSASDPRKWAPQLFQAIGYKPFADLREADISTKLPNWKGQDEDELNLVKRGRLRGSNIRFADATRAFFVGADLNRANLQGIYLYHANMRRADLAWADLKEAFAYEADFQGTILQNADLRAVDFTGSNLSAANLKGARLDGANFENVNLNKTNLSGTSLKAVKGLTAKQIEAAVIDETTQLPEDLKPTLREKPQTQ